MSLVPPPKGVTVEREAGGLLLRVRWFGPQVWFMVLWCICWDCFLVGWYIKGFSALAAGEEDALTMLLFPLLHVAAGVGVSWWTLARLVNHTELRLRGGSLEVRHGPLPWPAPPRLPTASLDQIYAAVVIGKNTRAYQLHARQKDASVYKLVGGLPRPEMARYLEQRIEAWLELEDRPVDGELQR